MKNKRFALAHRPKLSFEEVIAELEQLIQTEARSYVEMDGLIRDKRACRSIRAIRIARDYVRDSTRSQLAVEMDNL